MAHVLASGDDLIVASGDDEKTTPAQSALSASVRQSA